jgi:nuclear pore complex protein Nup85
MNHFGHILQGFMILFSGELCHSCLFRVALRGLSKASVFFLRALSRHPSKDLQGLALRLVPLVEKQPRLRDFHVEREFVHATRRWKDNVKALRIDMEQVAEADRQDEFENWWDRLSDIVSILEGRGDAIKRICTELEAGWQEVCAAWGIFVDARLRGQDLP